jgi:hypothetical protein
VVATWLLENFVATQFGANIFEGSDNEVGNAFVPDSDGVLTALRWYRADLTAAQKPTQLRVWDTTTGTVLYAAGSIPDSAGYGWKAHVATENPAMIAQRKYIVSMAWQTNRWHTLYGLGSCPPCAFPLSAWTPMALHRGTGTIGMPGSPQNGYVYGVDVRMRSQNRPLTWEAGASQAFTTEVLYMVPANRYTVEFTVTPQWQTAVNTAAGDVRRVTGFWMPIVGGVKGERRVIDATNFMLSLPGWQLMDGVLLNCYPGTVGTIQAWTVDDAL